MTTESDGIIEFSDMCLWYGHGEHETCPNCGVNLRTIDSPWNLYPHWTGSCKETAVAPQQPRRSWLRELFERVRYFLRG